MTSNWFTPSLGPFQTSSEKPQHKAFDLWKNKKLSFRRRFTLFPALSDLRKIEYD